MSFWIPAASEEQKLNLWALALAAKSYPYELTPPRVNLTDFHSRVSSILELAVRSSKIKQSLSDLLVTV